jgi:hypothetical protein
MVFKNKYKEEGSKQPDYRIYFDNNLPKNGDSVMNPASVEKAISTKKSTPQKEAVKQESKNEEIPF